MFKYKNKSKEIIIPGNYRNDKKSDIFKLFQILKNKCNNNNVYCQIKAHIRGIDDMMNEIKRYYLDI